MQGAPAFQGGGSKLRAIPCRIMAIICACWSPSASHRRQCGGCGQESPPAGSRHSPLRGSMGPEVPGGLGCQGDVGPHARLACQHARRPAPGPAAVPAPPMHDRHCPCDQQAPEVPVVAPPVQAAIGDALCRPGRFGRSAELLPAARGMRAGNMPAPGCDIPAARDWTHGRCEGHDCHGGDCPEARDRAEPPCRPCPPLRRCGGPSSRFRLPSGRSARDTGQRSRDPDRAGHCPGRREPWRMDRPTGDPGNYTSLTDAIAFPVFGARLLMSLSSQTSREPRRSGAFALRARAGPDLAMEGQ